MKAITSAMRGCMAADGCEGLKAAIGAYLLSQGDDDVHKAFDKMVAEARSCGEVGETLLISLADQVVAATVETVSGEWSELLDGGVLTTDMDSVVGMRCVHLLVLADLGMGELRDVSLMGLVDAKEAVCAQCAVFLYG